MVSMWMPWVMYIIDPASAIALSPGSSSTSTNCISLPRMRKSTSCAAAIMPPNAGSASPLILRAEGPGLRTWGGCRAADPPDACLSNSRSHPRRRGRGLFRLGREVLAGVDEPVGLEPVLLVVELPVPAVERQQLRMRAALHDLAGL